MEEIIEAVRRTPHERNRQRIVEETVKDVPEADQGQPTFEGQPKDFRADTICTGAVVVSDSESFLASEVASKDSCAHVTADHEVSAKTSAEELRTLARATQVIGSQKYSLFQVSSFTGVHPTVDLKGVSLRGSRLLLFFRSPLASLLSRGVVQVLAKTRWPKRGN